MRREDLRIGNKVHSSLNTTEGERLSVVTIRCIHLNVAETEESGTWPYSSLKPIPLTEKILTEWCGFKSPYPNTYQLKTECQIFFFVSDSNTNFFMSIESRLFPSEELTIGKVEFLHDLQNLFYYHNNKNELTIKT